MTAIKKDVTIGDCRAPDCERSAYCKGYCEPHYRRFTKYGDPLKGKTPIGAPITFLTNVAETDDCIDWPFGVTDAGYGQIRYNGTTTNAHRVSLIIHSGEPQSDDMHAAHAPEICHNRLCVNPRHLRWATPQENMRDRAIDGTQARPAGESHGASKLTTEMVLDIRLSNKPQKELAAIHGVSKQTISRIIRRERWSHV